MRKLRRNFYESFRKYLRAVVKIQSLNLLFTKFRSEERFQGSIINAMTGCELKIGERGVRGMTLRLENCFEGFGGELRLVVENESVKVGMGE